MKLWQVFKESFRSLNANKTRAFLTVLGIVIGVGAVIALLSIGQGAESAIYGQMESIGTNVVYILSGNFTREVTNARNLTLSDAEALMNPSRAPSILRVAPVLYASGDVKYESKSMQTELVGISSTYAEAMNLALSEGSTFSTQQIDSRASVVILGPDIAERLLGRSTGVVGQVVRINDYPFRVIGITEAKGGSQFNNPDRLVYLPISTTQMRFAQDSTGRVSMIVVKARDSESVESAIAEAREVMRYSHRLSPRQADDFTITNQEEFLSLVNSITSVLTIFLAGIAGISLLVGGIGIMNIMLVSVTERTREIGLRKALGARKADIMMQFLTESALLSLIGGVLGIGLGAGLAALVGWIAARSGTPLNPNIGLGSIALATVFSTAVGLFFGWYPASRAASLEPVEALRYE